MKPIPLMIRLTHKFVTTGKIIL
jgi:hypothetical protein